MIWYHENKPIKESSDVQLFFRGDHCSLLIQGAVLEDMGVYQVKENTYKCSFNTLIQIILFK